MDFVATSVYWLLLPTLCWVVLILLNPFARFRLRKVPGPRPLPILGNLLDIKKEGECFALDRWAKEYGDIFKVWIGPTPMWVVTDPMTSRMVLSRHGDRPAFPVEVNEKFRVSLLATANGEHYRLLKAAWTPMFLPNSLAKYPGILTTAADNLVKSLAPHVGAEAVDLLPYFEAQTMEAAVQAAFGVELHTQHGDSMAGSQSEDQELVKAAFRLMQSGAAGAASRWALPLILFPSLGPIFRMLARALPDPPLIEFKTCRDRMLGFVYDLIRREQAAHEQNDMSDTHNARHKGVNPGSFLSLLINNRRRNQFLTEEEIAIQVQLPCMYAGCKDDGQGRTLQL